jgi:hypothetical protein
VPGIDLSVTVGCSAAALAEGGDDKIGDAEADVDPDAVNDTGDGSKVDDDFGDREKRYWYAS